MTVSAEAGPWPTLSVTRVLSVYPAHAGVVRSAAAVAGGGPYVVTGAAIASVATPASDEWAAPWLLHVGQVRVLRVVRFDLNCPRARRTRALTPLPPACVCKSCCQ